MIETKKKESSLYLAIIALVVVEVFFASLAVVFVKKEYDLIRKVDLIKNQLLEIDYKQEVLVKSGEYRGFCSSAILSPSQENVFFESNCNSSDANLRSLLSQNSDIYPKFYRSFRLFEETDAIAFFESVSSVNENLLSEMLVSIDKVFYDFKEMRSTHSASEFVYNDLIDFVETIGRVRGFFSFYVNDKIEDRDYYKLLGELEFKKNNVYRSINVFFGEGLLEQSHVDHFLDISRSLELYVERISQSVEENQVFGVSFKDNSELFEEGTALIGDVQDFKNELSKLIIQSLKVSKLSHQSNLRILVFFIILVQLLIFYLSYSFLKSVRTVSRKTSEIGEAYSLLDHALEFAQISFLKQRFSDLSWEFIRVGATYDDLLSGDMRGFRGLASSVAKDIDSKKRDVGSVVEFDIAGQEGGLSRSFQLVTVSTYTDSGEEYRLVMLRDNTEEVNLRKELIESATEARKLAQVKNEFVANISHELRTPMNAVLGLSQVLANKDRFPVNVAEQAQKIVHSAKALQRLLSDILDFSKIDSGNLTLSLMPTALSDVQADLAVIVCSLVTDKNIDVVFEPVERDISVVCDQLRLEQVLTNLLSNAIKFTDSGWVSFEITTELSQTQAGIVKCCFSVTDTGIGMTSEQLQRSLQPFSQADNSIGRRFGGTGLGLTISQTLLELMGSELEIETEFGKGTKCSFTLMLPLGGTVEANYAGCADSLDVIILDESRVSQDVTARVVSSIGWNPYVVYNTSEALDLYKERKERGLKIDIFLVEESIAALSKASVIKLINDSERARESSETYTIVMSKRVDLEAVYSSFDEDRVDLIINKPITGSDLLQAYTRLRGGDGDVESINTSTPKGSLLGGKRILVVDDNSLNREVAKTILESEGAAVNVVENGQQAIDWLDGSGAHVDLVLMDVQMPILDGLEATKALRKSIRFAELPILGMSAGASRAEIDRAISSGMNAYITKPIDIDSALLTITEQLGIKPAEVYGSEYLGARESLKIEKVYEDGLPLFNENSAWEFWKNEKKLISCIKIFISNFTETFSASDDHYGQISASAIHKLRGSASAIFLERLRSRLDRAEAAIKNENGSESALSEVFSVWLETLPVLKKYMDTHGER